MCDVVLITYPILYSCALTPAPSAVKPRTVCQEDEVEGSTLCKVSFLMGSWESAFTPLSSDDTLLRPVPKKRPFGRLWIASSTDG